MAWAYFDHGKTRHWMSMGNVRTAQYLKENGEKEALERHLESSTFSRTPAGDFAEFKHPMEMNFPAQQNPGFEGVPPTDPALAAPAAVEGLTPEQETQLANAIPEPPVNHPTPDPAPAPAKPKK